MGRRERVWVAGVIGLLLSGWAVAETVGIWEPISTEGEPRPGQGTRRCGRDRR